MNQAEKAQHSVQASATAKRDAANKNGDSQMNGLVERVIEAHGGQKRWRAFDKLTAQVVTGGFLWGLKGFETDSAPRTMTAELRRQAMRIEPFGNADWHLHYEPGRVLIETRGDETIVEQENPRETFAGHTWETPWTPSQLGYFSAYAVWTYLNLPFLLGEPGFEVGEIPSINEEGISLKGLRVRFPEQIHTHSTEQSLYFDESGLLRRHDYEVEIAGNNPATHFVSDYVDVQGLKFPTKRRVFVRSDDGFAQLDRMPVSIDLFDFQLS
jgi:hypothetical protein